MKLTVPKVSVLVLGLSAALFGCSDSPNPVEPSAMPASLAVTTESESVNVLKRNTGLSSGTSVTKTIGPSGGTIAISGAGIKVVFPQGAVATSVPITVTAPAGSSVAYTFRPHGLRFSKPVRVEVSLLGTQAANNSTVQSRLEAGYFTDGLVSAEATGVATVSEFLPVAFIDAAKSKVVFSVRHFSGYLLISGRKK